MFVHVNVNVCAALLFRGLADAALDRVQFPLHCDGCDDLSQVRFFFWGGRE
jgi:hypothetical protein